MRFSLLMRHRLIALGDIEFEFFDGTCAVHTRFGVFVKLVSYHLYPHRKSILRFRRALETVMAFHSSIRYPNAEASKFTWLSDWRSYHLKKIVSISFRAALYIHSQQVGYFPSAVDDDSFRSLASLLAREPAFSRARPVLASRAKKPWSREVSVFIIVQWDSRKSTQSSPITVPYLSCMDFPYYVMTCETIEKNNTRQLTLFPLIFSFSLRINAQNCNIVIL